jgi:hypothetical protein
MSSFNFQLFPANKLRAYTMWPRLGAIWTLCTKPKTEHGSEQIAAKIRVIH